MKFRLSRGAFLSKPIAGFIPEPIQTMPCCMASVQKYVRVENLSPLIAAEFVNPPANLSRHEAGTHVLWLVASEKRLNCQDGPPMCVGHPNSTPSAAAMASHERSSRSPSWSI